MGQDANPKSRVSPEGGLQLPRRGTLAPTVGENLTIRRGMNGRTIVVIRL